MAYGHDEATTDGKVSHGNVSEVINDGETSNGEIFGQARSFYVDRTYTFANGSTNNRNAWAAGGYIGYTTPDFSGFSATAAVYGTYGFEIHDRSLADDFRDGIGTGRYDPSLQGYNGDNYIFFGQAYLNYKYENTNIKAGRQRLDTPLAGADDARMLPNLFEAIVVSNTDVENTTLIGAHVFRETVGTFANVYMPHDQTKTGSILALHSGYGLGAELGLSGDFVNMGTIALGDETQTGLDNSTAGVTAIAAVYSGIEGLKLQAWDYIAWDILNAVYLQGDYNFKVNEDVNMFVAGQYINESDIGTYLERLTGAGISSNYGAAKIGVKYEGLTAYAAYSISGSASGPANLGTIMPWGGMPAFTQGMVTRHQFFADTDTWKVAATYNFKDLGVNLKATAYYASFDMGENNSYSHGDTWTATEPGFDFIYTPESIKGLQLRFRGNFPRDFSYSGTGWDEYRLIANYNF
jgi:hypothetical protein